MSCVVSYFVMVFLRVAVTMVGGVDVVQLLCLVFLHVAVTMVGGDFFL